jgi:hypothetical protein
MYQNGPVSTQISFVESLDIYRRPARSNTKPTGRKQLRFGQAELSAFSMIGISASVLSGGSTGWPSLVKSMRLTR